MRQAHAHKKTCTPPSRWPELSLLIPIDEQNHKSVNLQKFVGFLYADNKELS